LSCPLGTVAISAAYASGATPEQVPGGNRFRFFGAQPAANGSGYTFIYTYGANWSESDQSDLVPGDSDNPAIAYVICGKRQLAHAMAPWRR